MIIFFENKNKTVTPHSFLLEIYIYIWTNCSKCIWVCLVYKYISSTPIDGKVNLSIYRYYNT